MENKYIYIDESGDTGYTKKSTRYFILTAVMVDDPFVLQRVVKSVHKSKINKNKASILHAYKETDVTKNKFIKKLSEINISCIVFIVDKTKTKDLDVYLTTLKKVSEYFLDKNIDKIIIARKDIRKRYNQKIINMFTDNNINAMFSIHEKEKSLQVADFYSWVIFMYIEKENSFYFDKLKEYITFVYIKTKPPGS
jgi:hypothetical protein